MSQVRTVRSTFLGRVAPCWPVAFLLLFGSSAAFSEETCGAAVVSRLLDDAAHPTTPDLGQGACQAIEDAVVIADGLRRGMGVEAALRVYERVRQPRTARIINESFRFGRICQWEHPVACWFRNTATRCIPQTASLRYTEQFFRHQLPDL